MLHYESVSERLLEILRGCMASAAFDGFCLAGGTSLALRIGHPLAIDIDLYLLLRTFSLDQMMGF